MTNNNNSYIKAKLKKALFVLFFLQKNKIYKILSNNYNHEYNIYIFTPT